MGGGWYAHGPVAMVVPVSVTDIIEENILPTHPHGLKQAGGENERAEFVFHEVAEWGEGVGIQGHRDVLPPENGSKKGRGLDPRPVLRHREAPSQTTQPSRADGRDGFDV